MSSHSLFPSVGEAPFQPSITPPHHEVLPDFPGAIACSQKPYINWSHEHVYEAVWTARPHTVEDVLSLCNWAALHSFCVRPMGKRHGWAPLTIGPLDIDSDTASVTNVLLLDLTSFDRIGFIGVDTSRFPVPFAEVQCGVLLDDFLLALEQAPGGTPGIGFGLPTAPAIDRVTVGGMLAVGAHGAGIATPLDGVTRGFGSLSNAVLAFTAVCYDDAKAAYVLKSFTRGQANEEDRAFLCSLGRSLLLHTTLRVENNYHLRCQSIVDIPQERLFAAPIPGAPVAADSFQHFVETSGRVEAIYFPSVVEDGERSEDASNPWIHVWTRADDRPPTSREITDKLPYKYMSELAESVSALLTALMGGDTSKFPDAMSVERFTADFQPPPALAAALGAGLRAVSMASKIADGQALATAALLKIQQHLTQRNFRNPDPATQTADLWGTSRCSLMYVSERTLRVTSNGYAIQMRRADLQRNMHFLWSLVVRQLKKYRAEKGQQPHNVAVEFRVTGVDADSYCGMPNAKVPYLSSQSMDEEAARNGWDTIVWFNCMAMPGGARPEELNAYYEEMEALLVNHEYFRGTQGRIRPEYTKGWAYSDQGGYTAGEFLRHVVAQLPEFKKAVAVFEKYDRKSIFWNGFLRSFMRPTALPQHEPAPGRALRRAQIARQRQEYRWAYDPPDPREPQTGPPFVEGLPSREKHGMWSMVGGGANSIALGLKAILYCEPENALFQIKKALGRLDFEDFNILYRRVGKISPKLLRDGKHPMADIWQEDNVFARQQVMGMNPLLVRRVTPEDFGAPFPVTDAMLRPTGVTLSGAIAAGKMYLCDYRALVPGITKTNYVTAPKVALYSHDDDMATLRPVAIQLEQEGGLIFTPEDHNGPWLCAKIMCQAAMINLQDSCFHTGSTHHISEAVHVAAQRNLAPAHPLLELMSPHGWGSIALNHTRRGRFSLSNFPYCSLGLDEAKGQWSVLIEYWKTHTWDIYDPVADIEARGMGELEGYLYRDFAIELWGIQKRYVEELVAMFYGKDADVARDFELQGMVSELSDPTIGNMRGKLWAKGRFLTREQLCMFLREYLWIATARHAMFNNCGWQPFGYIPCLPMMFRMPIPTTKAPISNDTLIRAMSISRAELDLQIQSALIPNTPEPSHAMLDIFGARPDYLARFPEARRVVERNQVALQNFSAKVRRINATQRLPYCNLDPGLMAHTINI